MLLLQQVLKSWGAPEFDPGPVDGKFGEFTEVAVRAVQSFSVDVDGKPLIVDGIVGEKTLGRSGKLRTADAR